jgi:hypothetical protein
MVPDCILGLGGFKKLCLMVDPEHSSLFPVIEEEWIL